MGIPSVSAHQHTRVSSVRMRNDARLDLTQRPRAEEEVSLGFRSVGVASFSRTATADVMFVRSGSEALVATFHVRRPSSTGRIFAIRALFWALDAVAESSRLEFDDWR